VWQRLDLNSVGVGFNVEETREAVLPTYGYGARAADDLAARATEGEGGIRLILDLDGASTILGPASLRCDISVTTPAALWNILRAPELRARPSTGRCTPLGSTDRAIGVLLGRRGLVG
jgi:hypothetical protein